MTATVTVAVGWTSVRPVIPDQYVSAVTLPLHLPAVVDDIAVRVAERHAMIKAFETVQRSFAWLPVVPESRDDHQSQHREGNTMSKDIHEACGHPITEHGRDGCWFGWGGTNEGCGCPQSPEDIEADRAAVAAHPLDIVKEVL